MVSHVVMVKRKAGRGVTARFSEAEWLKSRGKVAITDPEPFCDFRRLWYTPSDKFSAQQGWRHGVRSRSLGHVSPLTITGAIEWGPLRGIKAVPIFYCLNTLKSFD